MRIIAVGWKDPAWTMTVTCQSCGTTLEISRDDLRVQFEHDICGPRKQICYRCCVCETRATFMEYPKHEEEKLVEQWGELPEVSRKWE